MFDFDDFCSIPRMDYRISFICSGSFALYIKRPRTLNLPVFVYSMAIQKDQQVEPLTEKKSKLALTPAKTLVISSTLKPAKGSVSGIALE